MSSDDVSSSSDDNQEQEENLELEGEKIKHYNVIYEIGRGSYSVVWLAFNTINKKFYALKVQNPIEYKSGLSEINFVKKLPKNPNVFNNLIEYFVESRNGHKYLCSVWNLHCSNIDTLIRKCGYENGLPVDIINKIMNQLIIAIHILHKQFKVFHGDIKTDNILIKGTNQKDDFIINSYYKALKEPDTHKNITKKILDEAKEFSKYKFIVDNDIKISLADFGTFCGENNFFEEPFGTRYYQAPEIILMGKCSYPVDIWALGCTYYELLTGKLLFNPIKCSNHSRDYYHLCLINDYCGSFPLKLIKKSKYGNHYLDSNGNVYEHKPLNIDIKFNDILKEMIEINSNKRITIEQLIKIF